MFIFQMNMSGLVATKGSQIMIENIRQYVKITKEIAENPSEASRIIREHKNVFDDLTITLADYTGLEKKKALEALNLYIVSIGATFYKEQYVKDIRLFVVDSLQTPQQIQLFDKLRKDFKDELAPHLKPKMKKHAENMTGWLAYLVVTQADNFGLLDQNQLPNVGPEKYNKAVKHVLEGFLNMIDDIRKTKLQSMTDKPVTNDQNIGQNVDPIILSAITNNVQSIDKTHEKFVSIYGVEVAKALQQIVRDSYLFIYELNKALLQEKIKSTFLAANYGAKQGGKKIMELKKIEELKNSQAFTTEFSKEKEDEREQQKQGKGKKKYSKDELDYKVGGSGLT